jgi:membrane-bound lytic murein transglycosylase D
VNQKEMGLRAFFISWRGVKEVGFMILSFFTFFQISAQQNSVERELKIPYEIKFANVTFQFNEVTRYILTQEITALSKDKAQKLENLDRFSTVLSTIESIMISANVPSDFRFLSIYNRYQKNTMSTQVLENGVYWCFDKEKAKDVDLIIDDNIDERKHLIMATKGAMIFLKRNQVMYNNWATTLYSCLASREVLKVLELNKKWKGEFLMVDTPAYSSLIQFLAFKYVLESEFAFYKNQNQKIVYEYKDGKGKTLNLIAADLKIKPEELYNANLWLKSSRVPSEGDANVLAIVPTARYKDIRMLDEMSKNVGKQNMDLGFPLLTPNPKINYKRGGIFYTINNMKGIQADMCDDFVNLAYKANLSVEKFLEYNDMTDKDAVVIGQVFYIEPKKNKADIPHHIVKADESLWDISQKYGVKLATLLSYNRMDNVARLQPGRVIWMKEKRPKNKPEEFIEIPVENKLEKPDRLKFDDELISKYVESEEVKSQTEIPEPEKTETVFESSVLVKNNEKTQKPVVKKVETERVAKNESFSEDLKESIPERRTNEKQFVVHEVKKGETLYRISVNYKVSVDQLYKLNNLKNNNIEIGDRIIIRRY